MVLSLARAGADVIINGRDRTKFALVSLKSPRATSA